MSKLIEGVFEQLNENVLEAYDMLKNTPTNSGVSKPSEKSEAPGWGGYELDEEYGNISAGLFQDGS